LRGDFVHAAIALIEASGREDQVTVRAVTRAVGAAPQSFYLHFPSVDALLWEVYDMEFAHLTERLSAAATSARSPRRRLDAVCRAYCSFAAEHPGAYRLMFSVAGRADLEWDGKLPGMAAFEILHGAVGACQPTRSRARTFKTASLLWAGLHGVVGLRHDRPAFPWPALDSLVTSLVTALVPSIVVEGTM
jgi:AcrR family transcriptional regulator